MNIFALMRRKFNLSNQLMILMSIIFMLGIILSVIVYPKVLINNAKNELSTQANALISTMDSVRKYNNDKVTPLLEKQSEEKLLLESIPSYAVHQVFDIFTNSNKDLYGEYRYKDAMINPTNPKDQATDEEIKIINKLQEELKKKLAVKKLAAENEENILNIAKDISEQDILNGKLLYNARPIIIFKNQKKCLSCHTSLKQSPPLLQELYKKRHYSDYQGFGWDKQLNEVIGAKIIYVPTDPVYKTANRNFFIIVGIFIIIFTLTIFLATLWVEKSVVQPLNQITQVAEAVSLGEMDVELKKDSNDEIGRLVDAFTRMKTSLGIAMRRLVQRSNRNHREPS